MARFCKVKGTKIYEIVISQLKDEIAAGNLGPGDALPPEKVIAEEMGVSRASVREALKVLEFMGFLESKPSEGTKISRVHPELLLEKLNDVSLSHSSTLLLDLMELREVLEPTIVAFASERATSEELQEIERIVAMGRTDVDDISRSGADVRFHLAMARASHNVFFVRLLESTMSMLEETRSRNLRVDRNRDVIVEEHIAIVKPLVRRDTAQAVKAVKKHLQRVRHFVEQGLGVRGIEI